VATLATALLGVPVKEFRNEVTK